MVMVSAAAAAAAPGALYRLLPNMLAESFSTWICNRRKTEARRNPPTSLHLHCSLLSGCRGGEFLHRIFYHYSVQV